jgi:SAM-dependent methyltransferase
MSDWSLKKIVCPVCGSDSYKKLGVRGNREYSGADPKAEPHIVTDVVCCNTCGFIYTNPEIKGMEHLELEHYRNAEQYRSTSHEIFRSRLPYLQNFKAKGSLLDVGAGKGEFLSEAVKAGYEGEGVEPSEEFCDYAEKTYGVKMHPGLLGTCEAVKGKRYDWITLIHVFEHVEDPNALMEVFKDYLNEDGLLFIEVPNTNSVFLKIIDFVYRLKGKDWSSRLSPLHAPFHKFGYTPKSMRYIMEHHDFEILKMWTLSGKDRGFDDKPGVPSISIRMRNLLTDLINLLGDREILCVIAKPRKSDG